MHWKLEPVSLLVKANCGLALLESAAGVAVSEVLGAAQVDRPAVGRWRRIGVAGRVGRDDGEGVRPVGERAGLCAEVQGANGPASSLHWKLEPGSLELNEKVGVALFDGSLGLPLIVVSGGVVSTVRL